MQALLVATLMLVACRAPTNLPNQKPKVQLSGEARGSSTVDHGPSTIVKTAPKVINLSGTAHGSSSAGQK